MTIQESGQSNYPEIELRKPIRPFSQEEVKHFLLTPKTKLEKIYTVNGNPISIAVVFHQIDLQSISEFAFAPFGDIHSAVTIDGSGVNVKSDASFCCTVLDIDQKFGPHDIDVLVTIEGEEEQEKGRIIGEKDWKSTDNPFFMFGPINNRRNGFLIPYEKSLSTLECAFE